MDSSKVAKVYTTTYEDKINDRMQIDELKNPCYDFHAPQWNIKSKEEIENDIGFSIEEFLNQDDSLFDSGSGLINIANQFPDFKKKDISISGISLTYPREVPENVMNYISFDQVPFDALKKHKLIVDVHGAFTFMEKQNAEGEYSPCTTKILLTLCSSLAPNGKLVICTDTHRLGDRFARKKIKDFIEGNFEAYCSIELYGEHKQFVRLTIDNNKSLRFDQLVYAYLNDVGVAMPGKVLWESKEENPQDRMQIRACKYMSPSCFEEKYEKESKKFK